jgi:hypothetical protein
MKVELYERNLELGQRALELSKTKGYALVLERLVSKKEVLLKEALSSKNIEDLRYSKGFIDGLDFFVTQVEQMIRLGEQAKKAH